MKIFYQIKVSVIKYLIRACSMNSNSSYLQISCFLLDIYIKITLTGTNHNIRYISAMRNHIPLSIIFSTEWHISLYVDKI